MSRTSATMLAAATVFGAFQALASTAQASGGIYCEATANPKIMIHVATGRLPVLGVLSARASHEDTTYATDPRDGEVAVAFGQGMSEADRVAIDFTDPNIERILISLRVILAKGDPEQQSGELTFHGKEPVAVNCEFE